MGEATARARDRPCSGLPQGVSVCGVARLWLPLLVLAVSASVSCCTSAHAAAASHGVPRGSTPSTVRVVRPLAADTSEPPSAVPSHGPDAAGCAASAAQVRECTAAVAAHESGDRVMLFAQQLVQAVPRCADAWQCLGAVLYGMGQLAAATQAFEKTVELAPTASHYRSNLGLVLYHQDHVEDAITHFRVAAALDPTVAVSQLMIGASLFQLRRYPEAIDHYQHVLASGLHLSLDAEARIRCSLVFGLQSMGRMQEASRTLEEAAGRIPALRVRHAVTQVPVVPASEADMVHWRRVTERAVRGVIAELEAGTLVIDGAVNPLDMGGDLGYWLTYQGFNDEPLRRDITRMYRLAYPILSYVAPRLTSAAWAADTPVLRAATAAAPPVLSRRIRVGFVSDHLSEHSVGKMITRLITFLPRSMFHVTVLRFLGATGWVRRAIDAAADVVVQLPEAQSTTSITESHALIEACQLDVLVFPEIGMHLQTYLLAFGRFAPVQVVTHGNSITSGLPDTVDYFMSLDPAEPDDGVDHYSEQLVRLATHHSAFLAPVPSQVDRDSALQAFAAVQSASATAMGQVHAVALLTARFGAWRGIARVGSVADAGEVAAASAEPINPPAHCEAGAVYLCPQTLYKIHPAFDSVLLRILELDPCGHIVLIEGTNRAWDDAVVSRIMAVAAARYGGSKSPAPGATALDIVKRLLLVPQLLHPDFLTLLAFADAIVDTHPFGGCTTTYEGLAVGTPVVSWPGPALRGRFTKALLERAGLNQCLVTSAEGLAATSVAIANATAHATPTDRQQQRRDISAAAKEMFEDGQAVQEWSDFLVRAVRLAALNK